MRVILAIGALAVCLVGLVLLLGCGGMTRVVDDKMGEWHE